ncbi:hypothetical protein JCM11491_002422 [Sporobolomyces phaffii]
MESSTDPATVRYLEQLALVLCPVARFSSSSSDSLAAARRSGRRGLDASDLSTKCTACCAEVVGGVTGSYWTERGHLWLHCDRCRCTTRRPETSPVDRNDTGLGKDRFESVKKRRRAQARRATDASSHPTQFRATAAPSASAETSSKGNRAKGLVDSQHAGPSSSSSRDPVRPVSSTASLRPLPSQPSSVPSSSRPSPRPVSQAPSRAPPSGPAPPESSLDSKLAGAKKRKRSKQPSGLAELLAKKKKEDGGGGGGGGGGGLGLQDFLQGL